MGRGGRGKGGTGGDLRVVITKPMAWVLKKQFVLQNRNDFPANLGHAQPPTSFRNIFADNKLLPLL